MSGSTGTASAVDGVVTGNHFDKDATTNPIERRMVDGFESALMSLLPTPSGPVLEVGCGEGGQLKRIVGEMPGITLVGLDLPDDDLAARWHDVPAAMVFGTAERLPFGDDSFDLVLALEVLEHVDDPRAGLREIARVARETVILSVPREPIWRAGNMARGRYLSDLGNTPGHLNHFSSRGFAKFASEFLDVDQVRRPLPWTMLRGRPRSNATRR